MDHVTLVDQLNELEGRMSELRDKLARFAKSVDLYVRKARELSEILGVIEDTKAGPIEPPERFGGVHRYGPGVEDGNGNTWTP